MRSCILAILVAASSLSAQRSDQQQAVERENALGTLMASQFSERNGTVDIPEVQAYLERVVRELAAAQPGDGQCCSVAMYARAEAESKPVTFPGGHLFVPAKLFFTSSDEAAFVRALGHAVAHAKQRDWVRMGAQAADMASIPLDLGWTSDDRAESLPLRLRPEFEDREERADEAAERAARHVTVGDGEFERIRDEIPLPTPRPSLRP
jgi:hypothetical protein